MYTPLFISQTEPYLFIYLFFNILPYGHIADYDRDESPTRILSFNCILYSVVPRCIACLISLLQHMYAEGYNQ